MDLSPQNNDPDPVEQNGYITVAGRKQTVKITSYILAGLFAAGLICLWFMIKKTTPAQAVASVTSEQARLEQALARITGMNTKTVGQINQIVDKFYTLSDAPQISTDQLIKNPFICETAVEADALALKNTMPSNTMQLYSVMASGENRCCMINDEILYEGDSIGNFTVIEIGSDFVRLKFQDNEIILRLAQ